MFDEITKKISDGVHKVSDAVNDVVDKVSHDAGVEATIYPTYGFLQNSDWVIPLRGWVHQQRRLPDHFINNLAQAVLRCDDAELSNFSSRFEDFSDNSRSEHSVTIQFDGDNEQHAFQSSDINGLIEMTIRLPDAKAQDLLRQQNSADRWLSFSVTSQGHQGNGRVNLIEPSGLSLVSDIDDTIKVTEVPGEKGVVLKNTFCHDFVSVPGMSEKYWGLGNAAVHYVSGGPWQLYQPLSEFISRAGFPAGTYHFNYFPKNFVSADTRSALIDSICGSLGRTYDHKVEQISRLIKSFPERDFILVGDSGELDVEVYRRIKDLFPGRVREIWIRDVVNDEAVNGFRLEGVDAILKAEKIVCPSAEHYKKLAEIIERDYQRPYAKNNLPPCGGV